MNRESSEDLEHSCGVKYPRSGSFPARPPDWRVPWLLCLDPVTSTSVFPAYGGGGRFDINFLVVD